MPSAEIDGRELYYECRGAGEPLLLIQGLGGNSAQWGEEFLDGLRGFELILFDHRGAGRSAPCEGEHTIAELAADALGLLDALGIPSFHVLGISMGGMVAQELVLAAPQRVRTLTLGCTFPGGAEATMTDMGVIATLAGAVLSGDEQRALRAGFGVMVAAAYGAEDGAFERFAAVASQHRAPVEVLMAQLNAVMGHDASARLGELTVPTLVVHGTEDRMLDVSNGELLARLIPGARLELLEGSGHLFFWEQPARSAQLVREHALAASDRQ